MESGNAVARRGVTSLGGGITDAVKADLIMGKVRLSTRVPDDPHHGLMGMSKTLVERPHDVVLAVIKLDVAEIRTMIGLGETPAGPDELIPVVRLLAIEPILHEPERGRLQEIYRQAFFARTGKGETLEDGGFLDFSQPTHEDPVPINGGPVSAPSFAGPDRESEE